MQLSAKLPRDIRLFRARNGGHNEWERGAYVEEGIVEEDNILEVVALEEGIRRMPVEVVWVDNSLVWEVAYNRFCSSRR